VRPKPRGRRPSTAALTISGARKASDKVIRIERTVLSSREASEFHSRSTASWDGRSGPLSCARWSFVYIQRIDGLDDRFARETFSEINHLQYVLAVKKQFTVRPWRDGRAMAAGNESWPYISASLVLSATNASALGG
jgi:hypothetical protein